MTHLDDAERAFHSAGLTVRRTGPDGLHVSRGWKTEGGWVQVAHDACGLFADGQGQFTAAFPSIGHALIRVTGTLDELVPLMIGVYRHHDGMTGPFYEAVREVVLKTPDWSPSVAPAGVRIG